MEAFTLLKHWKGGGVAAFHGGANVRSTNTNTNTNTTNTSTTVVRTTVSHDQTAKTDEEDDDDGPYIDLEFTQPDEEDDKGSNSVEDGDEEREDDFESEETDGENDETDFEFTPSSMEFNGSDSNSKSQFQASLLKSASKFRAMVLKLKKSKFSVSAPGTPKQAAQNLDSQSKFLTGNLKIEESGDKSASDHDKRFSEEVKQRYLKIVKPLYVRVSKRYGEKLRFSGQSPPCNVKSQKQVSVPAGLRAVRKHLGKSRSASSVVAAAPTPASEPVTSRRRDDSLLQQQDGIQSAILHCKKSFKASRDSSQEEGKETTFEVVGA
ncbi:probable membrane-associated kinase regulator 2 [Cornus florida]|uniref:probable membrane-associated kinase regulator 2 n=1 Tax=Cornus florida TaxID=4283 RepID=UPI00289F5411|nr:probable membrane-associated kinase regulator 2 [Cornus florida]